MTPEHPPCSNKYTRDSVQHVQYVQYVFMCVYTYVHVYGIQTSMIVNPHVPVEW